MDKDYFNMFNGFNGGCPPYYGYDNSVDNSSPDGNANVFNPIMQYEQAYMYYRYLTQQIEYKIKCKEYEKMCSTYDSNRANSRKIE